MMRMMNETLRRIPRLIILVSVLAVVLAVAHGCQTYFRTRTLTTTVTDKERVCSAVNTGTENTGTECKYLVFTLDGTFQLSDSLVAGRYDSSDLYGQIQRGQRYRLTVYGWRFGPSSMYPNIKTAEEIG